MVRASPPSASVLDWDALTRRFGDTAGAYAAAAPFPHAVFHDLFEPDRLRAAADEFPDLDDMSFQVDRDYALKSAEHRWEQFGPATRGVIADLQSGPFVDALEALTGISGLIPDPHLAGGGQHQIRRDGFLRIHADFNALERLSLDRRINVLLYLNDDWDESWGGALELWDRSMTSAVVRVPPTINTLVVFSTSDEAFHGHPDPLRCPPGRSRRSLAFYYYTSPRPFDAATSHSTLYQTRPEGRDESTALPYGVRLRLAGQHARRAVSVLVPPPAKAKLRSVLGRAEPRTQ